MARARLTSLIRMTRDQSGVAAIEFAFILPLMLILFFGLIDVTALISDNRRLTYSAALVADLVTRIETEATPARLNDAFAGARLMMRGGHTDDVRVEVYNYRRVLLTTQEAWRRDNGVGTPCEPPAVPNMINLMAAGNNIVVVVACTNFTSIIARVTGYTGMGATTFRMSEQVVMRPRYASQLP